jgi:uncharacterized membrane protein
MSEPLSIEQLEVMLGRLLRIGVTASSLALAAGLAAWFVRGSGAVTTFLLTSGVLLLIATPAARVLVSSVGYARRREWLFVVLTLIVFAELVASVVVALRR